MEKRHSTFTTIYIKEMIDCEISWTMDWDWYEEILLDFLVQFPNDVTIEDLLGLDEHI